MSFELTSANLGTLSTAVTWGFANPGILDPVGVDTSMLSAMRAVGADISGDAGVHFEPPIAAGAFKLLCAAQMEGDCFVPEDVAQEREVMHKLAAHASRDALLCSTRRFAPPDEFLSYVQDSIREVGKNNDDTLRAHFERRLLRDYQEEAAQNVVAAISEDKHGGLVVLPTGTGKTVLFVEVARRAREMGLLGGKKTLVLVHRNELVEQAKAKFEDVFGKGSVSVVSAGQNSFDYSGQIVIASVQTLASKKRLDNLDPNEFGLVIVDETHHVVANTWRRIHERLGLVDEHGKGVKSEGKFLLGVTATPDRSDGVHLSLTYPDGLLFSKSLGWFIRNGYLVKPEGVLAMTRADLTKVKLGADGDYQSDDLGRVMSADEVTEGIVDAYDKLTPNKKALIFAASVDHAKALAEAFNKGREHPKAAYVDGTMDPEERKAILDAHREGRIDILINFGILTEGYDDPTIKALINARPTRSRSLYTQMLGRGLRPDPADLLSRTITVVDITGNITNHELDMDLAKLFGLQYVGAGLPVLDVVEAEEKIQKILSDEENVRKIKDMTFQVPEELEYISVSLFRDQISPLSFFLHQKLVQEFGGNTSKMAWKLLMREDVLGRYVSGDIPDDWNQVRKDLAYVQEAFGVSIWDINQLWQESLHYGNIGDALEALGNAERSSPDADVGLFFRALSSEWLSLMKSQEVSVEHAESALRQRLWMWEQREMDISRINDALDRHDHSSYKRSQMALHLRALAEFIRKSEEYSEKFFEEAHSAGIMPGIPAEIDYPEFIGIAHRKGLYTGEIEGEVARKKMAIRAPGKTQDFFDKYLNDAEVGAEPNLLAEFAKTNARTNTKEALRRGLAEYFLNPKIPLEKKTALFEIANRQGFSPTPVAGMTEFQDDISFLRLTPLAYLEQFFRQKGLAHPEFLATVFAHSFADAVARWVRRGDGYYHIEAAIGKLLAGLDPAGGEGQRWPRRSHFEEDLALILKSAPDVIRGWLGGSFSEKLSALSLETSTLVGIHREMRKLIDAMRDGQTGKKEIYYEDVMKMLGQKTGLSEAEIKDWCSLTRGSAEPISLPRFRPASDADRWLQILQKSPIHSYDGVKDKQRKARAALTAAGLDTDYVLATAFKWQASSGAERAVYTVLFERFGFKPPKT